MVTTTLTYVVPSGGFSVDSRIEVDLPSNWWPLPQLNSPSQDGYITSTTTANATLVPVISFSSSTAVTITVQSGSLPAASQVYIVFHTTFIPLVRRRVRPAFFGDVKSAVSTTTAMGDLSAQPSQTYVAGTAQWVGYNPQNTLTIAAGQPSAAIVIQANDNCGQPVVLGSSLTVNLQGASVRQRDAGCGVRAFRQSQLQPSRHVRDDSFREFQRVVLLQDHDDRDQFVDPR